MSPRVGSRIGAFEIVSTLGAGGMGEVFRARDTELGRDVAIKFLSSRLSGDADALARFEREARLLASLNHPHIGTLYAVVPHESGKALVLELVSGDTLADLILRRALSMSDALRFADEVADALEAAHERAIVHRDLKPGNIKLTDDGAVKVLDFGIAKALEAGVEATTVPASVTATGAVIGTRHYMSPEQARGLPIDKRTDVWAFGCVLYEMLTGRRAFDGSTPTDVLSAILEREPDWTVLPASTPRSIRRLLRRALAKDPRDRLRDIGDARLEIAEARSRPEGARPDERPAASSNQAPRWRTHAAWAAVTTVTLTAGLWSRFVAPSPADDAAPVHLAVSVPPPLTVPYPVLAISADGRKLAFVAEQGILLRDFGQPAPRLLRGTAGATTVCFSPDGHWLGFHIDGRLRRISTEGGESIAIADVASTQRGFSWQSDEAIIAGITNGPLSRIPVNGGAAEPVTTLDPANGETSHRWPHVLPGGRAMLFAAGTSVSANEWNTSKVVAQSFASGQRRTIADRGSMPAYGGGYVFYVSGRSLLAQRFDPEQLEVSGPVITVLPDVIRTNSGSAWYAVSANGTLAALRAPVPSPRRLLWMDRKGTPTPLPAPAGSYTNIRLSPDGSRVAVTLSDPDSDIWVFDVARSTGTRITTDGKSLWPVWSADGGRLIYTSTRDGPAILRARRATGGGDEEVVLANSFINRANSWLPGGFLVFMHVSATVDLWTLRPGAAPERHLGTGTESRVSPDGRWLVYRSTVTGRAEVYLDSFPVASGAPMRVTTDGGYWPVFSPDGREIFFSKDQEIWSALVTPGSRAVSEPRLLFRSSVPLADTLFDVAPDGRFLVIAGDQPVERPGEVHLTLHIDGELRRRGAAGQ